MISRHMSGTTRFTSPRRRAGGIAVGLFYLFTAAVLPTLHAETEDILGSHAVEDGHSAECDRIHDDATCLATGAFRALTSKGTPILRVAIEFQASAPLATLHSPPTTPETGPPAARGPPTA